MKVLGRPYIVYPWIEYLEQEVIDMFKRPGREVKIISVPPQEGKTTYCLGPETPVLTEDLEWVPIGSVHAGDRLVAFDEEPIGGGGRGGNRQWRSSEVLSAATLVKPSYRVILADGTETIASGDHLWLTSSGRTAMTWRTTEQLHHWQSWDRPMPKAVKLLEPWSTARSWEAGYLAGMFDGEGHVHRTAPAKSIGRTGLSTGLSQRPNEALDLIIRCLKEQGYGFSLRERADGCRRVELLGGRPEALRFLGSVRPERLMAKWQRWGGADTLGAVHHLDRVSVERVEPLGEHEVVALQTATNTLVADGFAHHNCGMWLPFWLVGMRPDDQGLFISYSDDYSGGWGLRVRNLVEHFGSELFNIGLNRSKQNINDWKTTRGFGGMLSAGIGGGITGNPGHWIIIDDVIKNMEEASSPTTKRKHLEEWDGSISARFQEETKVLIVATRWAEDDLSGEVYARSIAKDYEGIPVSMVRIKAVAEPDEEELMNMTEEEQASWTDVLGRKLGQTLDGQHSRSFFLEKRASVSPYVWSALYQASPSARKGSMFPPENWGWYNPDEVPPVDTSRRSWDLAATEGGGDFTVGAHVAKVVRPDRTQKVYILDVRRFQKSTSGVKDEVLRAARADGMGVKILMEQERAGAGKSTVEGYEEDLRGWEFEGKRPDNEKVSRYTNYSDLQQRGHVLLPKRADGSTPDWVPAFIAEHKMQMPDGRGPRHDDQLDAVSLAINDMYGLGPIEILDPARPNRQAREQVHDIASSHGVKLQPQMPDHLRKLLRR